MRFLSGALFFAAFLALATAGARADVILSVGYYDLPPCCGNPNPVPNPWYGSPNTTFLGSASEATSSDPDEAALLFTNTGTTAVTLDQGVTVTSGSTPYALWDSLIGAGGFSILPGESVILSGTTANAFDGSDLNLVDSTISFDLNGNPYSAVDSASILAGFAAYDETQPWTQVGDFLGTSPVPEPGSLGLVSAGLFGLLLALRRKTS
ncbi:MAG: PEP-CTERM sorting domain-containing protein [Bryobacteraceae bacterium]